MSTTTAAATLALFGGQKHINRSFARYNPLGVEEVEAAKRVVEGGVLSQFIGCWDPDFFGGQKVQEFERACERFFGVKHAVTVNSLTSGLEAAIGAIGIEPGDEVIVSPWTMSASATAILHWNAIPVFADIEPDTFCLDPKSVEANITPYTKAIVSVDICGQSADMEALTALARKHGLKIISDAAQAPGAKYHGQYAGTVADIGGFSLNYHKHVHTGEGGVMVTNDDALAERMQLIRNHAEVVVEDKGVTNLANMIGHNFRLGEIESAIGIEQLKKLPKKVAVKQREAEQLTIGLHGLDGLATPAVRAGCTHSYYVYPMIYSAERIGVSRARILEALSAEGVPALASGYQNTHLLPMYQQKIGYGSKGFPWTSDICRRDVEYSKGICPVAEDLHENRYIGFGICMHDFAEDDIGLIVEAFHKVWNNLEALR